MATCETQDVHIPAVYSGIGTSHMFVLPLLCSCYPVSVSDKRHYGYAMGEGVYVCIQVCVKGLQMKSAVQNLSVKFSKII